MIIMVVFIMKMTGRKIMNIMMVMVMKVTIGKGNQNNDVSYSALMAEKTKSVWSLPGFILPVAATAT